MQSKDNTPKKSSRLQSQSPNKTPEKYQSPISQQPEVYIQEPHQEPLSPFSLKQVRIFETPSPRKAKKIVKRRSREDRQNEKAEVII